MQISKLSPVSFNGQYRNVQLRKLADLKYRARVLDSQKDSGYCFYAEEAVKRAIRSSNDYKNYNEDAEIVKRRDIIMNRKQKETIVPVYYTDKDETVDENKLRPNTVFVVYAPPSGAKKLI